ncbi:conjugal transfer mating-pair stabilization protein TraG [Serratia fonticola]|uniref:conjugal transfer mating-pair stabilization protein TraG n=1 Tax=Serratia fonticola TaxID=47917 RepID=UPI00137821EF|nr:conjugal transfer mating-pair stabilization protein TraG [Serratia fonticola]NCG53661.1 conjugal transfer mating pair stabilization protein TraG [Serratia fonticola]
MTEIYTIAGGDWLRQCLNAVAAFMQTGTWAWMRNLAVALSTLFVVYLWIVHHDVMKIVGWIFTLLFVSVLFMRKPVQIIDLTDQAAVYQVDNVPVGIVLPASLITRLGHIFTLGYELVFSQPDVATYSQTGMLFGASLMSKSTDFLSQNPEYTNLFSDYVQNCVLGDIFLNQKYTLEALMQSPDPYTLIFAQPSPLRGVFTSAGVFQTCAEAAVPLKNMLALDNRTGGKTYSYYARQLFAGKPNPDALFGVLLGNTYSYFQQNAQTASEILKQNVVMNGIREGFLSNATRSGDTASMLNIATTTSLEKQRLAQASTGQIILRSLPILQVVLMGILIGIFPIIVMLGMINLGVAAGKTYVFAWVWLMTWPLLYAILNSAMTFYAQKNGVPVVLSNLSQVQLKYSDIATTAGWLSTMIPFLSLGIATGLGKAFSSVSSSLGSSMLSSSSQASSSVVDANYAYNNMQTDNVQGNSWNTNSTTSFGQMSQQTGSGATQTQTRDGSTVWDSSGAMSKLPVDISASRQISSASQQMAREAESQAQTAMSGYNSNVTSTWNTLSQFSSQSGNSDSLIRGADSSVGSNQSRNATIMASAVDNYAKANNISKEQANSELLSHAVGNTAGTDTKAGARVSIGGSVPGIGLGGGFEGYKGRSSRSDTANTDTESTSSGSRSSQDARHDQSAQAMTDYKRGFDELTSAKTSQSGSHTDNNADSRVDQLSASLSGAKSSYQQYSNAHNRSHEYAEMASRTENMSGQSSESLNQQFANFVAERSPENAEQILTNTGSPEVAAQRDQLVRAFVSENVTPKVDADYSNNRQVLGIGMDSAGGGGNAATVSDDYAGHQAQVEERTQGAGIRSDVGQGVNALVEKAEGKVAENSAVIDAQQQHVEGQRQSLQENHATQSTQHNNDYTQGAEKQTEYREKGLSIIPESGGGTDEKANSYINEKYGISSNKGNK